VLETCRLLWATCSASWRAKPGIKFCLHRFQELVCNALGEPAETAGITLPSRPDLVLGTQAELRSGRSRFDPTRRKRAVGQSMRNLQERSLLTLEALSNVRRHAKAKTCRVMNVVRLLIQSRRDFLVNAKFSRDSGFGFEIRDQLEQRRRGVLAAGKARPTLEDVPSELDLALARPVASLARGVVQEGRLDRLFQLVSLISDQEHIRDMSFDHVRSTIHQFTLPLELPRVDCRTAPLLGDAWTGDVLRAARGAL